MADELDHRNAVRVFELEGEFQIAGNALKQAWVRLQRKYHEAGSSPDPKRIAQINAAYGVLKGSTGSTGSSAAGGPDSRPYWVWAWDGERLTRGVSERFTSSEFPEVARAAMDNMSRGFRRPRAIFLQDADDEWNLLMIHMSGRDVVPPRRFPRQGNINLAQDSVLLRDIADSLG